MQGQYQNMACLSWIEALLPAPIIDPPEYGVGPAICIGP